MLGANSVNVSCGAVREIRSKFQACGEFQHGNRPVSVAAVGWIFFTSKNYVPYGLFRDEFFDDLVGGGTFAVIRPRGNCRVDDAA